MDWVKRQPPIIKLTELIKIIMLPSTGPLCCLLDLSLPWNLVLFAYIYGDLPTAHI